MLVVPSRVGAYLLATSSLPRKTMKNSFKLHEVQQKKKDKELEQWIHQPICCVCKRECEGYYGRWGNSGTCDSACEKVQAAKPRFPEHNAASFEILHSV